MMTYNMLRHYTNLVAKTLVELASKSTDSWTQTRPDMVLSAGKEGTLT